LLTATLITSALAIQRNLGGLRGFLDRRFASFSLKNGAAGLLAILAIWGLESWVQPPHTGLQNLLYLWELCGVASVVYLATLAILRAFPIAPVAEIWPRANRS
jgi:hypothetical protein